MMIPPALRHQLASLCVAVVFFGPQTAFALLDEVCWVVGVTDGDTLKAVCKGEQITLRFAGIDAPERKQDFGQAARQHLASLAFQQNVRVVQSKKSKSFGRIVGNVFDARGQDIGLQMVQAGMAWHYKVFAHEQTAEDRAAYGLVEEKARAQKIGLWQQPNAVAPWNFRRDRSTKKQ